MRFVLDGSRLTNPTRPMVASHRSPWDVRYAAATSTSPTLLEPGWWSSAQAAHRTRTALRPLLVRATRTRSSALTPGRPGTSADSRRAPSPPWRWRRSGRASPATSTLRTPSGRPRSRRSAIQTWAKVCRNWCQCRRSTPASAHMRCRASEIPLVDIRPCRPIHRDLSTPMASGSSRSSWRRYRSSAVAVLAPKVTTRSRLPLPLTVMVWWPRSTSPLAQVGDLGQAAAGVQEDPEQGRVPPVPHRGACPRPQELLQHGIAYDGHGARLHLRRAHPRHGRLVQLVLLDAVTEELLQRLEPHQPCGGRLTARFYLRVCAPL